MRTKRVYPIEADAAAVLAIVVRAMTSRKTLTVQVIRVGACWEVVVEKL